MYWNTQSFVEWLKRIKYKYVKSFYGYWQTDKQCINKIQEYIQSNQQRFGIVKTNENDGNSRHNASLFRCNDDAPPLTFSSPGKAKKKRERDGIQSSQSQSMLVANQRRHFLDSLKLGSSRSYPVIKKKQENEMEEEEEEEKDGYNENNIKIDIFKGEYLEYFDRYILDKIGIKNEIDCNIVFNEIVRLKRKYPNLNNQIENDIRNEKNDQRQCNVCCERETTHILQCGHHFCEFCIDEFRKTTNRCAICKTKISMVIKMY